MGKGNWRPNIIVTATCDVFQRNGLELGSPVVPAFVQYGGKVWLEIWHADSDSDWHVRKRGKSPHVWQVSFTLREEDAEAMSHWAA